MKPRLVVGGIAFLIISFLMAWGVDFGLTLGWPAWARGVWVAIIIGFALSGIFLAALGSGLIAAEALNAGKSPDEPDLSAWHFIAAYAGILVVAVAGGLVLEAGFGIDEERGVVAAAGAVFLLAATKRPWWLFRTIRNVRWFALIPTDSAMRLLLALIGLAAVGWGLSG